MMHYHHELKRLQHSTNSDLHLSSHHYHSNNSRINSFDYCSPLVRNEAIEESTEHFSVSNTTKFSQPFKPGPNQARRGGGGGVACGRYRYSSISLPKRAINYDLAESFMDHSTNPLSSDLYKIRFKHSTKQWPNGRFINYKEKLDRLDGNIIDITCKRTYPIVHKRKKMDDPEQNTISTISSEILADSNTHEQKKKQADKQTNFYANLFGCGKTPLLSSTVQIKKSNGIGNSTKSSTSISLLGENKEDHQAE